MNSDRLDPSAGWTPGSKGEGSRASALWGKRTGGGIARFVVLALAVALCAPMGALAKGPNSGPGNANAGPKIKTKGAPAGAGFVAPGLLNAALANRNNSFKVIVSGNSDPACARVVNSVQRVIAFHSGKGKIRKQFSVINGVAAELTGDMIAELAQVPCVSVVEDIQIARASYSNEQLWPQAAGVADLGDASANAPTIAIVDTGIDSTKVDFGNRVLTQVDFSSDSGGDLDGRGHGTMVAAVAAGSAEGHAGSAPGAKLVSLKVFDKDGVGTLSGAINAADWIFQHKAEYGIKVANFSLNASVQSSFQNDPLDQAVERLWFGGVTVVVAAGNYGTDGTPSGVLSAPANDPFVITVGASDTNGTVDTADDFQAPWSAWGHTLDGFSKPEIGAPGRVMIAPISKGSTMIKEQPDREVEPGYMWISGTSFAAPVVSGAAADVLAAHPDYTPDQVKGALLYSAKPYSANAPQFSLGLGVVDGAAAAAVVDPPNPNAALNQFIGTDAATGLPIFQTASWATAAEADASWATASWATASWATASWATASWATASWATASWATASWATASWATASWATASWATAAQVNASWFS